MDQLLEWPWLRMERFYAAFILRETIERLDRQKDAIVAALHANSVYDEHQEANREEAVRSVEDSFNEIVSYIRMKASGGTDPDDDYDESNPFWAAAQRGVDNLDAPRHDEGDDPITGGQMVEAEREGRLAADEIKLMMDNMDQS